jgi:hypothetical protein
VTKQKRKRHTPLNPSSMGEYITIPLRGEVPLYGEEGVFIFNGYFEKCKKYI